MKGLDQIRRDEAAAASRQDPQLKAATQGQQGPQVKPLDAATLEWCANALRVHANVQENSAEHPMASAFPAAALRFVADTFEKRAELERSRVLCVQCGSVVEDGRRCYATPICHACLPPPEPLKGKTNVTP